MAIIDRLILFFLLLTGVVVAFGLSACSGKKAIPKSGYIYPPGVKLPATQRPYEVNGKTYYPLSSSEGFVEEGLASWYGKEFHGKLTSTGETYDMHAISAAHKILPMNTYVRVSNLENGREVVCRINDRGPFVKGRIIDLSYEAAKEVGLIGMGTAMVRVEALGEGSFESGGTIKFVSHVDFEKGMFFVQAGSFLEKERAYSFRDRLAERYGRVEVVTYKPGAQMFYRVQVYASDNYNSAKQFEQRLEHEISPDCFVVAR